MFLRSIRWYHWVCLAAIFMMASALRCFNLSANSLWTDEYVSLECSSGWARSDLQLNGAAVVAPDFVTLKSARPWTSIWSSIAGDENHPPVLRRTGWIPAAVIAGCCAICMPSTYVSILPDYREISRFIARSSKPSDPALQIMLGMR